MTTEIIDLGEIIIEALPNLISQKIWTNFKKRQIYRI